MTLGKLQTSILTDIANAIRFQNGTDAPIRPLDMADAVRALNGHKAGQGRELGPNEVENGLISSAILDDIADALRAQTHEEVAYRPEEMAAAIRALSWTLPKALLLADGTLEFVYSDNDVSPTGGAVVKTYYIDAEGYESYPPWYFDRETYDITAARFTPSFASAGMGNLSHWFSGLTKLKEVQYFDFIGTPERGDSMFAGCSELETISIVYEDFYDTFQSSERMFYGCRHLVGPSGYVPDSYDGHEVLNPYNLGVLTPATGDWREWCYFHLYDDGELVVTAAETPEPERALVQSGRLSITATYREYGVNPVYYQRERVRRVAIAPDMSAFMGGNIAYWFSDFHSATAIAGLGNLPMLQSLKNAFSGCTALTELDYSGIEPSYIVDLTATHSGCAHLERIYVDAGFKLTGRDVVGSDCFLGCEALEGGAGTAYSDAHTDHTYMRIDSESAPEYLTAKE